MTQLQKLVIKGASGVDNFQTPDKAVEYLIPYLSWLMPRFPQCLHIWECANGSGNIKKVLSDTGFQVIGTDKEFDFIETDIKIQKEFIEEKYIDVIITNPPYSLKNEFIERCYMLDIPFALLLPLTALESARRHKFWRRGVQIIIPPRRINFETPSGKPSRCWFPSAWFTRGITKSIASEDTSIIFSSEK